MQNNFKKLIAILLSFVMCFSPVLENVKWVYATEQVDANVTDEVTTDTNIPDEVAITQEDDSQTQLSDNGEVVDSVLNENQDQIDVNRSDEVLTEENIDSSILDESQTQTMPIMPQSDSVKYEIEPNNTPNTANRIYNDDIIYGRATDDDYFKIVLNEDSKLDVKMVIPEQPIDDGYFYYSGFDLYDGEYNFIGGTHTGSNFFSKDLSKPLPAGTYYLKVISKPNYSEYDYNDEFYYSLYVNWNVSQVKVHTLKYDGNGNTSGTIPVKEYCYDGQALYADYNFGKLEKHGYYWAGWNTQPDGKGIDYQRTFGNSSSEVILTNDLILYALWKPVEDFMLVTYYANGGISEMGEKGEIGFYKGDNVQILSSGLYLRNGFTLVGFNTKTDGTGIDYVPGESYVLNEPLTLYAQWKPDSGKISICFDANGGDGAPISAEFPKFANVKLIGNIFTKKDHVFVGWNTKPDGTGKDYVADQSYTFDSDVTLYAKWKPEKITLTLTYDKNGGTGTADILEFTQGTDVQLIQSPFTKKDYVFQGWNTKADGTGTDYVAGQSYTFDESVTLYAKWKLDDTISILEYDANGGTGTVETQTFDKEISIIIRENGFKKEGYTFSKWNTKQDGTGDSYIPGRSFKSTITKKLKLYAQWVPNGEQLLIEYDANGGIGTVESQTFTKGSYVDLRPNTVYRNDGYIFNGWSENPNNTSGYLPGSRYYFNVNKKFYACWIPAGQSVYYLRYYPNTTGYKGSMPFQYFVNGMYVNILDNKYTKEGYTFAGWNTKEDGTGETLIPNNFYKMSGYPKLYAQWKPAIELKDNTYPLTWPTDSGEITLWFGYVDEQYQVSHKGIDIQGRPDDIVYSISNGEVVYNGIHAYYGNVVYVNYRYEGKNMQARYAHLSSQPNLSIGQSIQKGDQIGTMSTDSTNGKGILELTVLESTDGEICSVFNLNTIPIDPMQFIERPDFLDVYLSYPMATTLDITGVSTSIIAPAVAFWDDPSDPNVRYRYNEDIDINSEAYLRKLVLDYASKFGINVKADDLAKKGVLTYNSHNDTATVNLNNRSVTYGVSLGNVKYINNRMVVKRDIFWYDFIGYKYANYQLATEGYFQKLDYILSEEKRILTDKFSIYSSDDLYLSIDYIVSERAVQIMINDVNNYGNTSAISDDAWRKFCLKFNEYINAMRAGREDIHYFRNKLNRAPYDLKAMEEINKILPENKKWILLRYDKSLYHMFNTDFSREGIKNLKFVSYDGIYEGVYNKDGILLTEKNDPWNMGTYNYTTPSDWIGHLGEDVYPYDWWGGNYGNSKNSGLPDTSITENKKNYEKSTSAQEYRANFVLRFKGKVE